MSSQVFLTPLAQEHIAAILAIEKDAHSAPWSEKSFTNELINQHSIFLVARQDGEVVGYGGVWLLIDEAHVTNVAVSKELQRQGIGLKLMNELLWKSAEKGMVCATLEVRESNKGAIAMYEKLGFKQTNVRKRYYPDNNENAVVMWLTDLSPWKRD